MSLKVGVLLRLKLFVVLSAWLLATGVQWDFAQVAGWSGMFGSYARTMSFVEAAKKTFSGEMCSMCKAVEGAKKQEPISSAPDSSTKGKVVLIFQPAPVLVLTLPELAQRSQGDFRALSAPTASPPTPPPRVA